MNMKLYMLYIKEKTLFGYKWKLVKKVKAWRKSSAMKVFEKWLGQDYKIEVYYENEFGEKILERAIIK